MRAVGLHDQLVAELGYAQVWARLVAGLEGLAVATPTSSALAKARRWIGTAPLAALFGLLAGAPRWRGLLLCAIDGTSMFVPDSPANLTRYGRQAGAHGGSGYPMLRLVAVVACGTRTIVDAVFGRYSTGTVGSEQRSTRYSPPLTSRSSAALPRRPSRTP